MLHNNCAKIRFFLHIVKIGIILNRINSGKTTSSALRLRTSATSGILRLYTLRNFYSIGS